MNPCLSPDIVGIKAVNLNNDFDLAHGAHCDLKNTLKHCGLWHHEVLMTCAMNCLHGSLLSPPRLKQFQETVFHYIQTIDVNRCPMMTRQLPLIIAQMGLSIDPASPSAAEVTCPIFSVHVQGVIK